MMSRRGWVMRNNESYWNDLSPEKMGRTSIVGQVIPLTGYKIKLGDDVDKYGEATVPPL